MLSEKEAIKIAEGYIASEGRCVNGRWHTTFIEEEQIWACVFMNPETKHYVDSPGVTIVQVNGQTGESSFFDVL